MNEGIIVFLLIAFVLFFKLFVLLLLLYLGYKYLPRIIRWFRTNLNFNYKTM